MTQSNSSSRKYAIASQFKKEFDEARSEIFSLFLENGNAAKLLRATSNHMDRVITELFINNKEICIIATGGYGREELFPYSDVDIVFLHTPEASESLASTVDAVLYPLWDLKLSVGNASYAVDDLIKFAKNDVSIRTNLLDARFICGDKKLYELFTTKFKNEIVDGNELDFVEAKLKERDIRHKKFGDSRFLLEPNIKESKGALRDLQTLYWLTQIVYGTRVLEELQKRDLLSIEEVRVFKKTEEFLWKLRIHMHLIAGKAEEHLTFGLQIKIAPIMGFSHSEPHRAVERLMKRYFLSAIIVGSLTRIVCSLLEMEKKRKPKRPIAYLLYHRWKLSGFILEGERLTTLSKDEFDKNPLRMMDLFLVACEHGLDVHPRTLQSVNRNLSQIDKSYRENAVANAQFMNILMHSHNMEKTMHMMIEVGFLGRFIPEFARIIGQTQFNMYHIYTVDEHTLVALGNLRKLSQNEFETDLLLASEVFALSHNPKLNLLYLALLFHDIAKGRAGDHSKLGERVAFRLARRFGCTNEEAETIAWLVENHLLFSETANKRDLSDEKTIADFVRVVQSLERLRLLLILTVCDVCSVAPGVLNSWKASLLQELYSRAEHFIRTGNIASNEEKNEENRNALRVLLANEKHERLEEYLELGQRGFVSAFSPTVHNAIFHMLRELEVDERPFALAMTHDEVREISDCIITAPDAPGLFSKLSAAFALSGVSIISAKIFTLKNGIAVDSFQIQGLDKKAFDAPDKIARLRKKLAEVLSGEVDINIELAKLKPTYPTRKDSFNRDVQVFIENDVSNINTVIEVVATDRTGLLYSITDSMASLNLSIVSAYVTTYGARAVDVFYVKDAFGHKITHEKRLQEIRERLLNINV